METYQYLLLMRGTRYINNCSIAKINVVNWEVLLNDTITYLRSDCDSNLVKSVKNVNGNNSSSLTEYFTKEIFTMLE